MTPPRHPSLPLINEAGSPASPLAGNATGLEDKRIQFSMVAVPVIEPNKVFKSALTGEVSLAWSEDSFCYVGIGAAADLRASGSQRFTAIKRQSARLWKRTDRDSTCPNGWEPRLFGGFSFQEGRAETESWHSFGDARFILPKLTYWTDGSNAWVSIAFCPAGTHNSSIQNERCRVEQLFAELEKAQRAELEGSPASTAPQSHRSIPEGRDSRQAAFEAAVAQVVHSINEGALSKVVTARCSRWTLEAPTGADVVWQRLRNTGDNSATFAFDFGGTTFLGSTPERLLSLKGRHLFTEAIAGTLPADHVDNERRLLASAKDLQEHALVVDELTRRLTNLSSEVNIPHQPSVKSLRYAMHLHTPLEATLDQSHHILDLVADFHPTPAVGGHPNQEALRWIRDKEPDERGWYSGPIGWMTPEGDGTFWVALRSALLRGGEAQLYAGAGIVGDSNPSREFEETEIKLQPLLKALGARATETDRRHLK